MKKRELVRGGNAGTKTDVSSLGVSVTLGHFLPKKLTDMAETLSTPITKMFGIKYPILLAGMNVAAGPQLAAAVTNAGGLGVIGGVGYTPEMLKKQIAYIKQDLVDKNAPFGIDLLLPQVGGNARKTNKDYTQGNLPTLIGAPLPLGVPRLRSSAGSTFAF